MIDLVDVTQHYGVPGLMSAPQYGK